MTNILKVEFLKTKHSVVRLLVWLLPVIAVLMMTAVFWDNQYLVQLMMGQWSYFWLNMSIGLLVGLSTYYQKQALKTLCSNSPTALFRLSDRLST